MAEDWPSPHHHESHHLPRIEDLPTAREGYDRERVQAAFDAFYRHVAQLDSTLRTLESVEVFRGQAGDLRAELRSLRAAGWAPYPRGYTLTPERSMLGSVPEAVPRIALEVVFLVVVAAVVAVAKLTALEIVGIMAVAVLITFLVELIAARDRRATTPIPAAPPIARAPAQPKPVEVVQRERAVVEAVQTPTDELTPVPVEPPTDEEAPADDGSGWAAFAEPAGPEPLKLMGALTVDEEQPEEEPVAESAPEPEPEREPEPEPEPDSSLEPVSDVAEADTGTIARRRFRRRKHHEEEPSREAEPAPKHVRVLPQPETAVADADLPPWERGFDDTEEHRRP